MRVWLLCIAALAVCLLLLLLGRSNQKEPASHASAGVTNQELPQQQSKSVQGDQPPVAPPQTTTVAPTAQPATATPKVGDSNNVWQTTLARWQAPIDFYGKVVDENSNPVPNASIHFRWIETPADGGERTAHTQSDSEGLFSLQGKLGRSLTVWFSKEGYFSSHKGQMGFLYALGQEIHSPDPRNPVIFRLWKKGQGAELITSDNGVRPNLAIRIPKDGTAVRVDFFQKQASATGQLEIRQNKPPWQEAAEWSFRMSIPDGGFVENEDEFQFSAPDTAYQPIVDYHFMKGETNWTTHVTKQFYITFGQPRRFGWFRIESDLAQETIFLTYAINPSGSRNLEPAN
jgi:hypothetical protein